MSPICFLEISISIKASLPQLHIVIPVRQLPPSLELGFGQGDQVIKEVEHDWLLLSGKRSEYPPCLLFDSISGSYRAGQEEAVQPLDVQAFVGQLRSENNL